MKNRFSYIIPIHNSANTIGETLDSVIRADNLLDIILVDDASTDATKQIIDSYLANYNYIKYIRNESKQGAGLSRNVGAHMAGGDILVFLDSDVIVPQDSGKVVEEYFLKDRIKPTPDAIVANRARECLYKDAISMYKNYWTSFNLSKLKGWTSFLCSSFFAIKKGAFMNTKGFRKINQVEDNDLGYRLSLNNYKIYFADDLAVLHKKRFGILSLLKREFNAGREGIKLKIENRTFGNVLRDKKFFAVNESFIYSFPFAFLFSLSVVLSIIFLDLAFLFISLLCAICIMLLNGEFLTYASCNKNYAKGIFYIALMTVQLNTIGLGMIQGLFDLLKTGFSKMISTVMNYSGSFIRLFLKSLLPPEQVTFFVTNRCDLNCGHCFVDKTDTAKNMELTTDEIDRISRKMGRVNYVTITGGEPFLRDDIVDIVSIISKNLKPSLITVLTNGYMTDKIVGRVGEILERCKRQNILVKTSMDGPPEIHDNMRLKEGSFSQARNTFVKLKNLKKVYRNLKLGIITTYTRQNKDHIEDLYEGVISVLAPDQYGITLERPKQANRLNGDIDIDEFSRIFKKLNTRMLSSAKGFFWRFRLAYKTRMADKMKSIYATRRYPMRCFAGILNAVISPEGDVFACEQLDGKLGSLREEGYDWKKIWHSPEARAVRALIKKRGCFCTNECYMPFNLSYDIKEVFGVLSVFMKNILTYRSAV